MRGLVFAVLLVGLLMLKGSVNGDDEDCAEGEEGCGLDGAASNSLPVAEKQNNLLLLTDENFVEVVKNEEMIMATFYAPW